MLNVIMYLLTLAITGWFWFQLSVKKKNNKKSKCIDCTLYSVDCMQYVVFMSVLSMHVLKNVGVMINYMSIINKNSGILISELHVLWPLEKALVFNNNEFPRKDVPWCCKNLNYKQTFGGAFALNCCITEQDC